MEVSRSELLTERMLIANVSLDIFSIMLSLIPVVYLLNTYRYRQQMNGAFLGLCFSNILMIIGDLSDWLIAHPTTAAERNALLALSVIYYSASASLLFFFALYMKDYLKLTGRERRLSVVVIGAICGLQTVFAVISPFTGFIFYVTEEGYHRGSLFLVSQTIPLACYLVFTAMVVRNRKKLNRREVAFFLIYIFIPLVCGVLQVLFRGISVLNAGIALSMLFVLVNIQLEHELMLRQKEKELAEQRIDIMLSQIQPHFLYNSLGTIHHLCGVDPEKAREAVMEFSKFLRGNMESLKDRKPIPFARELGHTKNYLYLEKQRFQERLEIVYDIREMDFLIPPLTLQPLVENAVRHGVLKNAEGGRVTIRTERWEDEILVIVEDNGVGMRQSVNYRSLDDHFHIGVENVRSRIQTMMGGNLEISSSSRGTAAMLRIPLGKKESR